MIKNKGFTLLELMITITMISIIVVITIGAMRLGYRSVDRGEQKMQSVERFRNALSIIGYQIQSIFLMRLKDDINNGYFFKGDRESLEFCTNYSIFKGNQGYVTVFYGVKEGEKGKTVYAIEKIIGSEIGKEIKLLEGVDAFYFDYFKKDNLEEKGEWVSNWAENKRLPEKVRMNISYGVKEFSIIIPIRVAPAEDEEHE